MIPKAVNRQLRTLNHFTSIKWKNAYDNRKQIRNYGLSVLGHKNVSSFLKEFGPKTACVGFYAGAGTRWIRSVNKAQMIGSAKDVDAEKPRCLAMVGDIENEGRKIPIGLYNLRAIKGIGKPYIVWGDHLPEIKDMVALSGIKNTEYIKQDNRGFPKVLGHGDGLRQVLPHLSKAIKFVITNFGGDANSRETIITSLIVLAAMQRAVDHIRPFVIIPTTCMESPKYPIMLDKLGFPANSVHAKLQGVIGQILKAQTNIGIRIYLRSILSKMDSMGASLFDPHNGYVIKGNKSNEFALDNIDNFLCAWGRARTLNIAENYEIKSSVKEWGDIIGFLAAQEILTRSGN